MGPAHCQLVNVNNPHIVTCIKNIDTVKTDKLTHEVYHLLSFDLNVKTRGINLTKLIVTEHCVTLF